MIFGNKLMLLLAGLFFFMACEFSENRQMVDVTPKTINQNQLDNLASIDDDLNRIGWQKPNTTLSLLGDMSDKIVAEIGAGTGYFTYRLITKADKVIATDINPKMIHYLDSLKTNYLAEELKSKLETRLVKPEESGLGLNEVDIVFISNTYAYIKDRVSYLRRLKSSLKPKAKIMIVDFKMRNIPVGPKKEEKIPLFEVEKELIEAGYTIGISDDTSLPFQYIIIATFK